MNQVRDKLVELLKKTLPDASIGHSTLDLYLSAGEFEALAYSLALTILDNLVVDEEKVKEIAEKRIKEDCYGYHGDIKNYEGCAIGIASAIATAGVIGVKEV